MECGSHLSEIEATTASTMSSSVNQQSRDVMGLDRRPNKRARVDPAVVPRVDPIVGGVDPAMAEKTAWMKESRAWLVESAAWMADCTARMEENTARMRQACEYTLDAVARFDEESERMMQANPTEHCFEFMKAGRVFPVNGDGFCHVWGDYRINFNYGVDGKYLGYAIHDKIVLSDGTTVKRSNSFPDVGTGCNPITLSSESVSGEADGRDLEDDGASAA